MLEIYLLIFWLYMYVATCIISSSLFAVELLMYIVLPSVYIYIKYRLGKVLMCAQAKFVVQYRLYVHVHAHVYALLTLNTHTTCCYLECCYDRYPMLRSWACVGPTSTSVSCTPQERWPCVWTLTLAWGYCSGLCLGELHVPNLAPVAVHVLLRYRGVIYELSMYSLCYMYMHYTIYATNYF